MESVSCPNYHETSELPSSPAPQAQESDMNDPFICDAIRIPFGRFGGALKDVRADDLGAVPIKALVERNPGVHWRALDDVIYGCANQASDANREAFASQRPAVLRTLGLRDDNPPVNANGGSIARSHPLGASGARLVTTERYQRERTNGRFAPCTMCIGVGQRIALVIKRV
jgi:acetyl-CoA acetyltransferase